MYRCTACDHPAQSNHSAECPTQEETRKELYKWAGEQREPDYGSEYRINIASGEDVVCG